MRHLWDIWDIGPERVGGCGAGVSGVMVMTVTSRACPPKLGERRRKILERIEV